MDDSGTIRACRVLGESWGDLMADKKYYWLKLKKDFFKRHDIQIIENMPNGKDYVLFYLKLLVESVDHNGGLRFNETIPYNEQMLSTITNTNVDTVSNAMKLFKSLGMVEILDDQTIYMNEVSKMLGAETYWAEKKREQRQKSKLNPPKTPKIGQCPTDVQTVQAMSKVEIEKEIELDIDIELDSKDIVEQSPTTSIPYAEVIDYLNQKTGKNFKSTSKATQRHIKARFADGFTLDDFKQVIDTKTSQWLKDKKMSAYLRPDTLFGTKFESYLNEVSAKPKQDTSFSESLGLKVW